MQTKHAVTTHAGFDQLSALYLEVYLARRARTAAQLSSPAEFAAAQARVARAFDAVRQASPLPRTGHVAA